MEKSNILSHLKQLKTAARELRAVPTEKKNRVLEAASQLLLNLQDQVLRANQNDLQSVVKKTQPAFMDRLTLNEKRIAHMAESLRQVAQLPDPVGEEVEHRSLKNGLRLRKVRSPLGVILMIFESRPNVAMEAFSLAFKSGNAIILKGGRESNETTRVLYQILEEACALEGVSKNCLWGIADPERTMTSFLLSQNQYIDVVVPRGGDGLIQFVIENSKIPIIKNDRGLCHVYVHEDADLNMAQKIVINAKTQRPGVCNAMETLLVHSQVAQNFLPRLYSEMLRFAVQWNVCPISNLILKGRQNVRLAKKESWDTEYLDLVMNCRVVSSLDEAMTHIDQHGSRHSESIITKSSDAARKFQSEVDAAAVYWNASTRFTDGFEFGLGGELGISTQKLHVRGPVGLRELTSLRWMIDGEGQTKW